MGKQPTPQQAAWQREARDRLCLILEQKFNSNQTQLAHALGVSNTLVNLVVKSVQPPTRNLMSRLGSIEGINPRWADTGEGEPFVPDVRGSLPVSTVLLPGLPSEFSHLMTGERFSVAPAFDRSSCYYWKLPESHLAVSIAEWRLMKGDLLLLDGSPAVTSSPAAIQGKKCVLSGACLGQDEPLYGIVTTDDKQRWVFKDDEVRLYFDVPAPTRPNKPEDEDKTYTRPRRKIRPLEVEREKAEARAADPWFSLPHFNVSAVLAVQFIMVRL